MKRSGFKRKYTVVKFGKTPIFVDKQFGVVVKKRKPMKRGKLRKASKQKISVLKRKLWVVFSLWIKKRDKGICFTCGRKCEGKGYHAGHFIPKSVGGLALYFDEDNVHGQCYNCNINLSGNQYIFGQKLGKEKVAWLFILKTAYTKWDAEVYLEKINHYQELLK